MISPITVLLVSHEPELKTWLETGSNKKWFKVFEGQTPSRAFEIIEKDSVDVVLTDHNGGEILNHLRSSGNFTPFVCLVQSPVRVKQELVYIHEKPVNRDALLASLLRAAYKHRSEKRKLKFEERTLPGLKPILKSLIDLESRVLMTAEKEKKAA